MRAALRVLGQALTLILTFIVRLYQLVVSPFFGQRCRYHPTCSRYAIDAMRRRGLFPGLILAVLRIARCHPWAEGGIDHVPDHGFRRSVDDRLAPTRDM
jgi:putative membrane protein insertion efficiency factor